MALSNFVLSAPLKLLCDWSNIWKWVGLLLKQSAVRGCRLNDEASWLLIASLPPSLTAVSALPLLLVVICCLLVVYLSAR